MPLHETRRLSADPETVSVARHFVVDALRAFDWDEPNLDVAALLTTELATNAVEHAHSPYSVSIHATTSTLRIDVVDSSTIPPILSTAVPLEDRGGRGLFFVAVMAREWGVDAMPAGKSVWFELAR